MILVTEAFMSTLCKKLNLNFTWYELQVVMREDEWIMDGFIHRIMDKSYLDVANSKINRESYDVEWCCWWLVQVKACNLTENTLYIHASNDALNETGGRMHM